MRVHHDHIDYPFFAGLGAWVNAAHLRSVGHEVTVIDAFTGERSGLYAGENLDLLAACRISAVDGLVYMI